MTLDYTLNPDKLNDAIHNTIRVFDNYNLKRKTDKEGRFVIIDRSWFGKFTYYITATENGSQLSIEASKILGKPLPPEELQANEELFLKNLYKIIDREIVLTP